MSVANVAMPLRRVDATRLDSGWRWVVLAFVCALSATFWAFTRIPMAGGLHGWTSRQCVTLEMQPPDWPCRVTLGRTLGVYLAASALVSLAVLVPTVVLVLRGRRLLAFVPMLAPLAITPVTQLVDGVWSQIWLPIQHASAPQPFLGPWGPWTAGAHVASVWRPDHPLAIGADLLLLAAPVLVMLVLFRPTMAARTGLSVRAGLLACGIAAGASVIVAWATEAIGPAEPYFERGWVAPGLIIVCFGLLLPLGPRRPLWTIPLVACLVSLGGPTAIAGSIHHYTVFTYFRAALPLALMGFAGAAASAFVARQRGSVTKLEARPTRFRNVTFAHGIALGLLALAMTAAVLDPAPYDFSTALPTYLGARERVIDLRSRMTLDEAMDVATRFRSAQGSFSGFDAHVARDLAPPLLWADGLPAEDWAFDSSLTVRVVRSNEDRVELVLVGPETTYCLRTSSSGTPTYGFSRAGAPRERAQTAVAACGTQPWIPDLLRPFPVERFCEDAPDIVMCRAVQRLFRGILASPTGLA